MTRLGIVSDTHGQVHYTRQAVHMLETFAVAQVIHCGDIGSPAIVTLFAQWPTHFVFGNVDGDLVSLRAAMAECGHSCHERFGTLTLSSKRIAFLHGDDVHLLSQTIRGGTYDLVCHGHTHVARQQREGRTLVLNPGALFRANPHSLAIVDLPSLEVTSVPL